MAQAASYIVLDIGKTLSKVTAWSAGGTLLDRITRPNLSPVLDGVRRLDAAGIADWLLQVLRQFSGHPVEAIIPVAHGAGFAAIGDDGLLFPPLDYEATPPEAVMAAYRQGRDPFALTGSPALPDGLNLGTQLHWAEHLHAGSMAAARLVPWAQYWAWFLSGAATSEVTSLGCHSDLWCPQSAGFSPMAQHRGWAERFAPLAKAGETIGTLRPALADATGLPRTAKVVAGLHDSNAALLAARGFTEIADNEATVLSTGTWFIAMRLAASGSALPTLPDARDTLINVSAHGAPVPSARFMGGREIGTLIGLDTGQVDIGPDQPSLLAAVPALLERGTMLLPTLAPGCGPFPHGDPQWLAMPQDWPEGGFARRAAICLYAALVADTSLDLIGARDRLLIEGRFAGAEVFVRALAALRPETAVYVAKAQNDVSFGALRLVHPSLRPHGELRRIEPLAGDLAGYRRQWHAAMAKAGTTRIEQTETTRLAGE